MPLPGTYTNENGGVDLSQRTLAEIASTLMLRARTGDGFRPRRTLINVAAARWLTPSTSLACRGEFFDARWLSRDLSKRGVTEG
jgi:hypothetical protein